MKNPINIIIAVACLTFSVLLTACHSGYEEKNGKIYHKWIHGGNWTREYSLLKEADASTFTTIEQDLNIDLGKDKNHVFKDAFVLKGADPATFEQVEEYYWKDKNHVYLLRFDDTERFIEDADPKTFVVINDLWTKDKNHVYYQFNELNRVNPETFVVIDQDWGKNDSSYYYHDLKLDSLNYKSAEIVSQDYIKDKDHVFFHNIIVKEANPSTFKADGIGSFGHDDKYMFNWEKNEGPITEEYRKTYIYKK